NDNAYARKVVAHGAPYVTPTRAGRSEGCPAMEPSRARRLLPQLANGAMVFLFAPNSTWLAGDPWIAAEGTTLAEG
ncbi:MAG: murein L,D-transpeptidase catalytic domain-containing protein, partial [Gemmatimonadaceae bacterium]